jgi:predicted DNA-binding transcriptional regulator AlpA
VNDARILITDKAAAGMLSMARSTFWTHVKAGLLPQPVKIGGLTRWRLAEIQLIGASPTTTPSDPGAAEDTPPGCTPPAPHQIPGAPIAAQ